jgi:hypothetical protein
MAGKSIEKQYAEKKKKEGPLDINKIISESTTSTSGARGMNKAEIAKEKKKKNLEMVSKQEVKEHESTKIPRGKSGLDLEARIKAKEEHKEKSKGKTFKDVVIDPIKKGAKKGAETLKKILTGNGKAKAAVVGKGGKSPGPKEKKKLSGMSAKEKARIAKKKADAKAAATREEGRKPKKAEAKKQAETGTRETSYEARVKALVAKKASLSKKETADGRSEYQVQMHKLKKENKKAWKKMFKGGKLKS